MKILFVTNDLSGENGYSTYTRNLIDPLVDLGDDISVALSSKNDNLLINQYKIFGLQISGYIWHPIRNYFAAQKLQKIINVEKPDVIHFIAEPYQLILTYLKISKDTQILLTVHGTYVYLPEHFSGVRGFLCKVLYSIAHKKIDKVIAVSEFTKKRYLEKNKKNARDVSVIHNATNITPITTEDIPTKSEPFHAITIGEVKARKGIINSLQVLSLWSKENKVKVVYDIVGNCSVNSDYVTKVKQMSNSLSHNFFKVVFHGRISECEKNNLLKNAALYMHLEPHQENSLHVEGFGIGIIDAAAYGVPALVSKGTATAEAVIDGKTGFAVVFDNNKQNPPIGDIISDILTGNTFTQDNLYWWAEKHQTSEIIKDVRYLYYADRKS